MTPTRGSMVLTLVLTSGATAVLAEDTTVLHQAGLTELARVVHGHRGEARGLGEAVGRGDGRGLSLSSSRR
jgi:hypothetical protein